MRKIEITEECLGFIYNQEERVVNKFFQLIEIIGELRIVSSNFLKKLHSTPFYELRIKTGNEYRVMIFAIDHINFTECNRAICLYGFIKKGTKDYKKAIKRAENILEEHLKK